MSRARICKHFKEHRSIPSLAESIPGLHKRLQIRAQGDREGVWTHNKCPWRRRIRSRRLPITTQKPAVERGGSGRSNASPPQPHPITSWFVDVSFKDVVTLLLLGVSFIVNTCGYFPRPKGDWMIYRGLGFLAVVWFGSTPTPSRQHVASLSRFCWWSPVELSDRKGRGGRGAESYDREKAWPSRNRSSLSFFPAPSQQLALLLMTTSPFILLLSCSFRISQ